MTKTNPPVIRQALVEDAAALRALAFRSALEQAGGLRPRSTVIPMRGSMPAELIRRSFITTAYITTNS